MEADKENDKRLQRRDDQSVIAETVVAEALSGGDIPASHNTLQAFVDSGGWDRHWAYAVVKRSSSDVPRTGQIDEQLQTLFEADARNNRYKTVRSIDGKSRPVKVKVMRGRLEDALTFRTPEELSS